MLQAEPHAPQLEKSVPVVLHVPPQHVWVAPQAAVFPHWQAPLSHWFALSAAQVVAQSPQATVELCRFRQAPPQQVSPSGQASPSPQVQTPPSQVVLVGQA